MSLSDHELDRYARQIVLPQVGGVGQQRLKAASVVVVGAGGIGSAVIAALAGAGVGRLTIIDEGLVERSNLHRQPIFRDDEVGRPKAGLAAAFASALNPDIVVEARTERIDEGNANRLIAGSLVLDGSDNFATRLAVSDACVRLSIPLVSAAAIQFQGQVGLWRGGVEGQACYRCFVGDAFDSEECDNCAELGVLGALTGTAGHFAALVAIHALVGLASDVAGQIFLFDGAALDWRRIRVPRDPACSACGDAAAR